MARARKTFVYIIIFLVIFTWGRTIRRWDTSSGLIGAEEAAQLPAPRIAAIVNSTFQRDFETFMTRKLGIRRNMVRIDNQLNFSLLGQINNERIVMGLGNSLFEVGYIKSFNRSNRKDPAFFEETIGKMRAVQEGLARRGKAFLFFIAPSKANLYPEQMPESLIDRRNRDLPSNYEVVIPLLREHGINFIDGQALMLDKKRSLKYPIFNRAGIHWSYYSGFYFTQELIARAEEATGRRMAHIESTGLTSTNKPLGPDADLADLVNLAYPRVLYDSEYHYHIVNTDDAGGTAFRPRFLWVGTSFSWVPLEYLQKHKVFDDGSAFLYYFNRRYEFKDIITETHMPSVAIVRDDFEMKKELLASDIVIVESHLPFLTDLHNEFFRRAAAALAE